MYGEYIETKGTSLVINTLTTELIQIVSEYESVSNINSKYLAEKRWQNETINYYYVGFVPESDGGSFVRAL